MDYFCWNLKNNKTQKAAAARSYLKSSRGFTAEQASSLLLGFVPEWSKVVRYVCVQKKFPKEVLDEVCCVENEDGYTAVGKTHVISIPYECGGELKGFLFRRTDDSKPGPKYIANSNLDRKSVFFNIPADRDEKSIVVVEGEMDALKATAEGIENVVAIGGSEIAGERRRQVEDAFARGVKKIFLCLDLDSVKDDPSQPNYEGQYAHVMRSVHTIKDVDPSFEEIYIVRFPEVSDPDEFIRNRGVEAFKKLIAEALPYWKYVSDYHTR
jgi:DNA primase